jgi:hypothetical protein
VCRLLWGHQFAIHLGKYQGTWLLDHMLFINFCQIYQIVFQNGCTILLSHWQGMRAPVSSHPHQCLVFSILELASLGVKRHLILICISLIICDVRHFLICLFAIDISSLVRWLLRSPAQFLIWLCSCCWILRVLCISTVLYQIRVL